MNPLTLETRRAAAESIHIYTADEFISTLHDYAAGRLPQPAGGYVSAPEHGAAINLRGFKSDSLFLLTDFFIEAGLDLRDTRFGNTMEIHDCTFQGVLDATDARISGSFRVSNTWFGLSGLDTKIPERLLYTSDHGAGDYDHSEVTRTSSLKLLRVHIEGSCELSDLKIIGHLGLEQAIVSGDLALETTPAAKDPFTVTGTVVAQGLTTSGAVVLKGTRLNGSLDLVGADVGGSLLIEETPGHTCQVDGDICMIATRINRDLKFSGVTCKKSIWIRGASVAGDLWASSIQVGTPETPANFTATGSTVQGNFLLLNARIHGDLELTRASLGQLTLKSNSNQSCEIDGNCKLGYSTIDSDIIIAGTRIGGDLNLYSARVSKSLQLGSKDEPLTVIGGDVDGRSSEFTDKIELTAVEICGRARFWRVRAGGFFLYCSPRRGCILRNGLDLADCHIGNFFSLGAEIQQGRLFLSGANMQLLLIGHAIIETEGKQYRLLPTRARQGVDADGLTVAIHAIFCGLQSRHIDLTNAVFGELHFYQRRHIKRLLANADIESAPDLDKLPLDDPASVRVETHLRLHHATINGDLRLGNITVAQTGPASSGPDEDLFKDNSRSPLLPGTIDLSHASIGGNLFTGIPEEELSKASEETVARATRLNLDLVSCEGHMDLSGIRLSGDNSAGTEISPGQRAARVSARSTQVSGCVNFIPAPESRNSHRDGEKTETKEPQIDGLIDFDSANIDELKLNGHCLQGGESVTPLQIQFSGKRRLMLGLLAVGLAMLFAYAFYYAFRNLGIAQTAGLSIVPWIGLCGITAYLCYRVFRISAFFSMDDNITAYSAKSSSQASKIPGVRLFAKTPYERQIEKAGFQDLVQVLSLNFLQRPPDESCNNSQLVLNLSGADIDHLALYDPIPAPMNIRDLNVKRLSYDNHEIDYEVWLAHGCEFDRANYGRIESMLHDQGENESADRVHRAMRITEQYLNRNGIKTALRLIHSLIGYGTRRARVLFFMLLWFVFTTWWISDVYTEGLTFDPVIAIEALGNADNTDEALDELGKLSGAVEWSRPARTDAPLRRWAISAAVALRYHVPIIDLDMVPLIKPYGTLLTYAEIVKIISWILWPLMIASLLPLLLPKRE